MTPLDKMTLFFVQQYYCREDKNRKFLSSLVLYNRLSGEHIYGIDYDSDWTLRQNYLYSMQRINYLNEQEINKGKTPVFITLTLSSDYHQFKKSGTKSNIKFNPENTISKGARDLQIRFRTLIKDFKVNGKYSDLKFIRVIEPHKDWTPHLHAVIYTHYPKEFKNYFFRKIKANPVQHDFKILDKANFAVTYLLKYVQKTLVEPSPAFLGWKIANKIGRILSLSNIPFNKLAFRVLSPLVEYDKEDTRNFLSQIISKTKIVTLTYREDSPLLVPSSVPTVKISGQGSDYTVIIEKIKYKKTDTIEVEIEDDDSFQGFTSNIFMDYDESGNFFLIDDPTLDLELEYYYHKYNILPRSKLHSLEVRDKNGFIIYDSKDLVLNKK